MLSTWNTSNVTDIRNLFNRAKSFNEDMGERDTLNVTKIRFMFYSANKDIGK